MKEAYGGIINFVFLIVFLLIVISTLALVVSYTKAFRMKDAIISTIEAYEGTGCYGESPLAPSGSSTSSACRAKIKEKAEKIAYNPPNINCKDMYNADGLYCYSIEKKSGDKAVFTVVTQVDMSFPIIERIMGFRFFQVQGDTRTISLQS
jgi:hypothetical protein